MVLVQSRGHTKKKKKKKDFRFYEGREQGNWRRRDPVSYRCRSTRWQGTVDNRTLRHDTLTETYDCRVPQSSSLESRTTCGVPETWKGGSQFVRWESWLSSSCRSLNLTTPRLPRVTETPSNPSSSKLSLTGSPGSAGRTPKIRLGFQIRAYHDEVRPPQGTQQQ